MAGDIQLGVEMVQGNTYMHNVNMKDTLQYKIHLI